MHAQARLIIFIYNSNFANPEMKSLQEFASDDNHSIFINASNLPIDPARVVKGFYNDPQANIRVFYYQYLKLCFELESVDYEGYINKIETILNNQGFKFIFFQDDDPSVFSDLQFKNLIMQFFGVLGEGNISVEQAITRYPIMDTVMIYFFRSILILTGRTDSLDSYIDREELLQYLCNYFEVEITFHDRCIKFVETDIFVYEQDPKEVFMAFMDYDDPPNPDLTHPQVQTSAQAHQEHYIHEYPAYHNHQQLVPSFEIATPSQLNQQRGSQNPPASSSSRRANQANTSYISSQFVDYTNSNANLVGMVKPNNLKESGSIEGSVKTIPDRKRSEDIFPKIAIRDQNLNQKQQNGSLPSYADTYTYSSQSNSSQLDYGTINQKPPSHKQLNNYSSHYESSTSNFNKNKQQSVSIQKQQWQPTKDPGFDRLNTSNSTASLNQYQNPIVPAYKPPSPTLPIYKPSYQSLATSPSPSFNSQAFKKEVEKPTSYTSSASEPYKSITQSKPLSSQSPKVPIGGYNPGYQAGQIFPGAGKNPFGLNVSLQFTNSFTMKAMCQPFKTNVYNTRQRARNYRDSLRSYVK